MSATKGPLLLVAGGCAAMLGAAALTVSLGSFFADLPTSSANAAAVSGLPVKKVKTVTLTPQGVVKTAPVVAAAEAPKPEPVVATVTQGKGARPAAKPPVDDDASKLADARWAAQPTAPNGAPETERKLEAAYAEQGDEDLNSRAAAAASQELGADGQPFSELGAAETEMAALAPTVEEIPSPAPRREAARATSDDDNRGEVKGGSTTVKAGVNMRAAPRSGSGVLTVVPAGAKVNIAPGCAQWCRISYKGRTGYVYKSFIYGGSSSRSRSRRSASPDSQALQEVQPSEEAGLFGNPGTLNNAGGSPASRAGAAQAAAAAAVKKPEKPAFVPPNR